MADLSELLARVGAATGPDREIDFALYILAGNKITNEASLSTQMRQGHLEAFAPRYTASIDAALALKDKLLPGCACAIGDMAFTNDPRGPWATIWTLYGEPKWNATAATPPLAILAALLRALIVPQEAVK